MKLEKLESPMEGRGSLLVLSTTTLSPTHLIHPHDSYQVVPPNLWTVIRQDLAWRTTKLEGNPKQTRIRSASIILTGDTVTNQPVAALRRDSLGSPGVMHLSSQFRKLLATTSTRTECG